MTERRVEHAWRLDLFHVVRVGISSRTMQGQMLMILAGARRHGQNSTESTESDLSSSSLRGCSGLVRSTF